MEDTKMALAVKTYYYQIFTILLTDTLLVNYTQKHSLLAMRKLMISVGREELVTSLNPRLIQDSDLLTIDTDLESCCVNSYAFWINDTVLTQVTEFYSPLASLTDTPYPFKATGWVPVGQQHQHRCIPSIQRFCFL